MGAYMNTHDEEVIKILKKIARDIEELKKRR